MKSRRFVAICLSLMMFVSTFSSTSLANGGNADPLRESDYLNSSEQEVISAEEETSTDESLSAAEEIPTDESVLNEEETPVNESVAADEETPAYIDGSLTGSDGIYNVTLTVSPDAEIPEGSTVSVKKLAEGDAAYEEAKEKVEADEDAGFAALDISILDAEGNEIEPKAAVQVEIALTELLDGMDADSSVIVNHINEITDKVEAVADTDNETDGNVVVTEDTVATNFSVDSFSVFTITYTNYYSESSIMAYVVDENGVEIAASVENKNGSSDWTNISNYQPSTPNGYEYVGAFANSYDGSKISQIRYNSRNGWQYRTDTNSNSRSLNSVYFVYRTTGPIAVTLSFDTNGGTGSVNSISGTSGDSVILPDYTGTRDGYTFLGWSESSADVSASADYRAIYKAGSSYALSRSTTLYAAWQSESQESSNTYGYFYIRLDGTIPYEPGSYAASAYTTGIQMADAVTVQNWIVDVDTTKSISGNCVANDVVAALNNTPDDDLIASVCEKSGVTYDPDTHYVLWYVQKYQSLGSSAVDENGETIVTNGSGWHIDGVLLEREKVSINYHPNVPAGVTTTPDVPLGYQVNSGTTVTVGEAGGVGGSMDQANPSIAGYTFLGWNTSADGSGTTYQNSDKIVLNESVTLYAMWSKSGNMLNLSKVDGLGNSLAGASFTLVNNAANTSATFKAGSYTNNNILTDTVYTVTETAAPANYEALEGSFSFIVSSQGGTGMTAYFCDADGNKLTTAPESVTISYTNGVVNIKVTNIGYFKVYHSSADDGDIETIAMTTDNLDADGTFNIVNKTANGYYYGGYYSKYNKTGTAYAGGAGSWTKANAYTTDGQEMIPTAGTTYYLKEVPAAYLQPYLHIVYDEKTNPVNELKKLYLMTGVDDLNYTEIGLNVTNMTLGTVKKVASFNVQETVNNSNTEKLTTSSIWGIKGYLGVWDQSADLKTNYEFTYQPYFVTPDGVKVEGATIRTVNTQNNHYYNTFDKSEENPGIYRIDEMN